MKFVAYAVTTEFDLNKLARQSQIPKKYTWEEPLTLQSGILEAILKHPVKERQSIFIFAFGSIVFIDIDPADEPFFIQYLKSVKPDLEIKTFRKYLDDYELRQNKQSAEFSLNDEFAFLQRIEGYHPEIVATILAKSVALERTEEQMGKILDALETMIDRLEKGKLRIGNKELARTTAKMIRHEYNTIAYIMILDKPEVTWTSSEAAEFYEQMAKFFELNDRYQILKQKTDMLNVVVGHFSSISHSLRGLQVEWFILILILVELLVMIVELVKG